MTLHMRYLPRSRTLLSVLRIGLQAWNLSSQRHMGLIAAGVAFFAILSVFPAMAALVAVWGMFADPEVVARNLLDIADFLPPDAFRLLDDQVNGLVTAGAGRLGWATAISLGAALWSARAGMSAMVQGLNAVFDQDMRGGIWHQVVSLLLTVMMVLTAVVALAVGVVLPLLLQWLPPNPLVAVLEWVTGLPTAALAVVAGIALVCRYGPNVAPSRRQPLLTPGLLVAVVLWLAVAKGFSIYLVNFGNYNKVYGSIGAVIALLMWLYLSAWTVLMGAAVNAVIADRADRRPPQGGGRSDQ